MNDKTKDIAVTPASVPATLTPLQIIQSAVSSGIGADELGKLMDLAERHDMNQARKAFSAAMSSFQADCPVIRKNKQGDKATYADLAFTVKTIKPILDRHGLSVRFDTELTAPNGQPAIMTAICYVTHEAGHTETNKFACPVDAGPTTRDGRKVMNSAQSTASARSYCKRYAMGDALNLVFADEVDDDAACLSVTPITEEQAASIREHIEALEIKEDKYLAVLGASTVDDIPTERYGQAMRLIERKKNQRAKS